MRSGRCSWKCFATGLLISTLLFITLVMLGALVAIPVIYARYKVISDKDQYSVMYAAEPEYANIYLYQWSSKEGNTAVLKQPYYTCHISYAETNGINTTLHDCLRGLVCEKGNSNHHCLPEWDKTSVPLYFITTRETDFSCRSRSSADCWDAVDEYVEDAMLKFFNQSDLHCVVLNESSESVATWIAANVEHLQHPDKYPSTAGVLYLGVASVQLSHMAKKDYHSLSSSLTHLSLYGRNYSIYSDTRWCSGVDELWKKIAINSITLGSNHSDTSYNDPCLPPLYIWNVNGSDLMSACNTTNKSIEGLLHFQNDDSDTYRQCEVQIDSLLDQASQSTSVPDGEYIAFGKFGEILKFFNTTALNSSTGWERYNDTLEKFCQSNWTNMKAQRKDVKELELSRRCYDGLLVRSLLMKSYGFTEKANWSINFSKDTNDSTWSLGYMLEEINSTISHKKGPPYTTTSLILSLVELVILLVLFSLFLISVIHVSCSDKNRNGYISISN